MQDEQSASQTAALSISNLAASSHSVSRTDPFPSIPTMIGTRLQLELLLQESIVDLTAISEIILSDAGATLQILRLIGEEYPTEEDRPTRMEDCLASLNMELWYEAICASSVSPDMHVLAHWQHSRRVAQCARELAKCVEGLAPEEAYLIGLLCEVGKLPKLLGWHTYAESHTEQDALGIMLADYWHLPSYLLKAIQDEQIKTHPSQPHHDQAQPQLTLPSRWSDILQMARQVASQALPA